MGSAEAEKAVLEAIKENEDAVEDYKVGKKEAMNFLVGQVMKKTRGRAEPKGIRKMLMVQVHEGAMCPEQR